MHGLRLLVALLFFVLELISNKLSSHPYIRYATVCFRCQLLSTDRQVRPIEQHEKGPHAFAIDTLEVGHVELASFVLFAENEAWRTLWIAVLRQAAALPRG